MIDRSASSAFGEPCWRWPAEWEPHAATWLAWPRNRDTWPGRFKHIPPVFARLIELLSRYEPVHLLAGGVMDEARELLGLVAQRHNLILHDIPTNDAWTRDHGPTFVVSEDRGQLAGVDWQYNAWGEKYEPYDLDAAAGSRILESIGCQRLDASLVLEGGAIETDGRGTVMCTRTCALHPRRNPDVGVEQVQQYLRDYLGATRFIWLSGEGLAGDDTDGHIDQLARFTPSGAILVATCTDTADPCFGPLQQNLEDLRNCYGDETDHEPIPLPIPTPIYHEGQRLPASYCNFYVANETVIVPQFGDDADRLAEGLLADLFPTRTVVGFDARELIWGLGAVHCLTQQQPQV